MIQQNLTFFDTNILLSSGVWRLYNSSLNKYKSPNENNLSYLTSNTNINENEIIKADEELSFILSYCDNLVDSKYCITNGVLNQTKGMITNIVQNIDTRASSYFYGLFGENIHTQKRENGRALYDKLTDVKQKLLSLENIIENNKYQLQYSRLHTFCDGFVRALNTYFFELGKKKEKYEGNTDEEIVVCSLYEALRNSTNVTIMSSDIDVSDILTTAVHVLGTYKPLMKDNEKFLQFLNNPPVIFHDAKQDMKYIKKEVLTFEEILTKIAKNVTGASKGSELSKFLGREIDNLRFALSEN